MLGGTGLALGPEDTPVYNTHPTSSLYTDSLIPTSCSKKEDQVGSSKDQGLARQQVATWRYPLLEL